MLARLLQANMASPILEEYARAQDGPSSGSDDDTTTLVQASTAVSESPTIRVQPRYLRRVASDPNAGYQQQRADPPRRAR
jgi:hypothetical protein